MAPQTPTHICISPPDTTTTWMSNKHLRLPCLTGTPTPPPSTWPTQGFPILAEGNSTFPVVQAKCLAFLFGSLSLISHTHTIAWLCSENSVKSDQIIYLATSHCLRFYTLSLLQSLLRCLASASALTFCSLLSTRLTLSINLHQIPNFLCSEFPIAPTLLRKSRHV